LPKNTKKKERQKDELDVLDTNKNIHAAIGYCVNEFADLEYQIDSFMLEASVRSEMNHIQTYPLSMGKKLDFIAECYHKISLLRTLGDTADRIDMNLIVYGIEEIWAARNIIVHGKMVVTRHTNDSFVIEKRRFKREPKSRTLVLDVTMSIGRGYLLRLCRLSRYISGMLWQGQLLLKGRDLVKQKDEIRKINAKGRELVRQLIEDGATQIGNVSATEYLKILEQEL